ncbi:MAG TPA: hypothetical protein VM867_02435 [Xanthobacteraceae bacterium]|nr:hypothetical protein [Xanthobacteraceae bacterium]
MEVGAGVFPRDVVVAAIVALCVGLVDAPMQPPDFDGVRMDALDNVALPDTAALA